MESHCLTRGTGCIPTTCILNPVQAICLKEAVRFVDCVRTKTATSVAVGVFVRMSNHCCNTYKWIINTIFFSVVLLEQKMSHMSDDVIRCILEHACQIRVRRNVHPLEARLAIGEWSTVSQFGERIMAANGIIRSRETILLDGITCSKNEGGVGPIWASKLVKTIDEETKPDDLCILEPIGDESGAYDDERFDYGVHMDNVPLLLPCLRWGSRKRASYSICLSHTMSVSVAFDVLVVPTSWWVDDCEGTFWVIQIVNACKPLPDALNLRCCGYSPRTGYDVVGWAPVQEEERNDEQVLQE